MARTIVEKLKIIEGTVMFTLNAPKQFAKGLGKLPPKAVISNKPVNISQVHWFVKNKSQLEKELSRIFKLLTPEVTVWVYYPKGSSGVQTDLTRDKGWDCLLAEGNKLTWISLISFDDIWSVFGFRPKTEKEAQETEKPKPEREIFKWVNPKTKEVTIPTDLKIAFSKSKSAEKRFEELSFTNKKEYLEWIVTAKRTATRQERISGTIERLIKGFKNPRDI